MNDAVVWLTIFVLSVFVGIEVISKCWPQSTWSAASW